MYNGAYNEPPKIFEMVWSKPINNSVWRFVFVKTQAHEEPVL